MAQEKKTIFTLASNQQGTFSAISNQHAEFSLDVRGTKRKIHAAIEADSFQLTAEAADEVNPWSFLSFFLFFDITTHFIRGRVRPSVRRSVRQSVRRSVSPSVRYAF